MNNKINGQYPHELILSRLKEMGFNKVEVMHFRKYKNGNDMFPTPDFRNRFGLECIAPRGGFTSVRITLPNGSPLDASAHCSDADIFNRRQGLTIALRRLYKSLKDIENSNVLSST